MPRDGSNVYSKPAGTTAVAGTTIEASKYNSTVDDLVTDANTARPIVAGGTGSTSAASARTALGVEIGSDVQAHNATLDALAATSIDGVTGSDVKAVTGTAGTDGNAVIWNADGDVVDGLPVPDNNDLSVTGAGLARRDNVLAAMQEVEVKDETLSNASEFTATVTGYSFYKVYLEALVPATDGAELRLRTSSTGGAPWDAGGSDYAHALIVQRVGSAVSESKSSGTDEIPLTGGIGNDTGEVAHGTLEIVGAAGSTPTHVHSEISYLNDSGSFRRYSGDSWRLASSAVTAIRIYMSTGNFSGRIVVKGIR